MRATIVPLDKLLPAERVSILKGTSKDEVIREMVDLLATSPLIEDPEALHRAVLEREEILSTGIGLGIAVPHAKVPSVDDIVAGIAKTEVPIDYGSIDDERVRIVVMIAAAPDQQDDYIRALAAVTLFLKNNEVRAAILAAQTPEEIFQLIAKGPV